MGVRADVEGMLNATRTRLAGAPREALAQWRAPKRVLGISRAPRLWPAGTAWHLGVLLLTDDDLLATGDIVRAREEERRGFTAESQRQRAAIAAAAFRGGFAEGQAVHLDWQPIDLAALDAVGESGPVSVRDGEPVVRWTAQGALMPLRRYLDERADLLAHPLPGAS